MSFTQSLALLALCATTALGAFQWSRGQCRIGVNSSSQVGSGTLTIGVSVSEVMAICLALQNAQLPPPYSFAALFYEDENNVANAPAEAAAMVGFPVVGIVGCRTSGMTAALNPRVGGIPQCSHASMSAVLSNKTLYPHFLRVPASDALTAYSMIMLLAQYRVTKIAAIGSDDSYGRAGIANLKLYGSRLSTPIQVAKDVYFNPLLVKPDNFTQQLCATTALGAFQWSRGQCRIGVNSSSQVGSGTLTIGVSVSVTAQPNIAEVMAVCLALQNAQLPPPYSFAAFFYEDENNVANAPAEAAAMVGFPVVGIVGCRTSGMTAALNPLVGGIPQCSHASMSAVLSNKTLFPHFLRTPASDALTAYSMIMLLAQYRVTEIAAIGSDDSYGRAGIANLKLYGSRLSTPIQVVIGENTTIVSMVTALGNGPIKRQFEADMLAFTNMTMPNSLPYLAYDAAMTFVNSIKQMISRGQDPWNHTELFDTLIGQRFTGATGAVSFDQNGDRFVTMTISTWIPNLGGQPIIGNWATWHGTQVAAKVILGSRAREDAATSQQFNREVGVMKSLRHPNVLLFMCYSQDSEKLIIVTEFMPSGSLMDVLLDEAVPVTLRARLSILKDVAAGMAYLHTNNPCILHCDLKSSNIMARTRWTPTPTSALLPSHA
eukprot:m51a1_g3596 putative map3k delta-1 protein (658) ;mRNA; f:1179595-1186435